MSGLCAKSQKVKKIVTSIEYQPNLVKYRIDRVVTDGHFFGGAFKKKLLGQNFLCVCEGGGNGYQKTYFQQF